MILFPDQEQHLSRIGQALRRNKRVVAQAPTGAGKTVLFSEIATRFMRRGKQVLVLVPRRELAYQAAKTIGRYGMDVGIIMAGEETIGGMPGYVASFDTLHARCVQRDIHPLPYADVVITDEVHLAGAPTRRDILNAYPDALHIGWSATPNGGLDDLYDDLVMGAPIAELIKIGRLVKPRYFGGERPNLEGVRIQRGDYVQNELAERVDQPRLVGDIVGNWLRIAADRQTVVFCINRKHSRHVCEEFTRVGIAAEHLDGDTPADERRAILARVATGETQVLTNVYVASYGLDIPELSCAVMARPTKSVALYFQTIGRVLRALPGKSDALILDHAGCVNEHGFIDEPYPWSLSSNGKAEREEQRKQRKEPKDIDCPKCHTIFRATHICPTCGHKLAGGKEAVPYHEADLEEIGRDKKRLNRETLPHEKRQFYAELLGHQAARGYKSGWAAHKYRERFGVWPNAHKGVAPAQPSDATRAYIQHLQIKFAKTPKEG